MSDNDPDSRRDSRRIVLTSTRSGVPLAILQDYNRFYCLARCTLFNVLHEVPILSQGKRSRDGVEFRTHRIDEESNLVRDHGFRDLVLNTEMSHRVRRDNRQVGSKELNALSDLAMPGTSGRNWNRVVSCIEYIIGTVLLQSHLIYLHP